MCSASMSSRSWASSRMPIPRAPVVGVGAEQGEEIVRLGPGMRGLEPAEELHIVVSGGPEVVGGQAGQLLLLLGRHVGATRRNPDGGRLPAAGEPGPRVAQRPSTNSRQNAA